MKKRILALVMILCLMPLAALAELTWEKAERLYITFPTMNEWRGRFSKVNNWVIVTPQNLEENWNLVAGRGDTEEEIRARYADESFLFEAYSPDLPADACFRAQVYENEFTRDVWHFRHWDSQQRKELNDYLMSGMVLPDWDVYSLRNCESGETANVQGFFTNYPPATHESGRLRIDFRNGRMYVFSYCVSGRLAGAARWYTALENSQYAMTPLGSLDNKFQDKLLPRLTQCEIDGALPEVVAPGDVQVTGILDKGAKLSVTLDGSEIKADVKSTGKFTVTLPLQQGGEHELILTATHTKYGERRMVHYVRVSDTLTALTVTDAPHGYEAVGKLKLTGQSNPAASLTLMNGETELAHAVADDKGDFRLDFEVEAEELYTLTLIARAEGKEENRREIVFAAEYEDINEAIKAFTKDLSETSFDDICKDVQAYVGEKVKISIYVKEVVINEQGLALIGVEHDGSNLQNRFGGSYIPSDEEHPMVYVNLPGYAQCQLGEKMLLTIYATVDGRRILFDEEGNEQDRVELTADYGTYIILK